MSLAPHLSKVSPQAARALPGGIVVDSGQPCPGCGEPLKSRKKACSGKCRAALSRRRRTELQAERDRKLRGLVEDVVRLRHPRIEREGRVLLGEALRLLENGQNRA